MKFGVVKGWIGLALVVWPIFRSVGLHFGVDLPELPGLQDIPFIPDLDVVGSGSQFLGAGLLASSDKLK